MKFTFQNDRLLETGAEVYVYVYENVYVYVYEKAEEFNQDSAEKFFTLAVQAWRSIEAAERSWRLSGRSKLTRPIASCSKFLYQNGRGCSEEVSRRG